MRPLESLLGWHRRYGDLFTVRFLLFGTGVYVADPEGIRQLFTGDQSDLYAGEANEPLSPVLGKNSVLILDGAEHMRQRKLLLPPFQGAAVAQWREVIREIAEAEVAQWRTGDEIVARERMRTLTFEVICRAVFGVAEPDRVERLREALLAVMDSTLGDLLRRGRAPGSGSVVAVGSLQAPARGRRRADLRGDRATPAGSPSSRSAPTCSRCCSARATRTATR